MTKTKETEMFGVKLRFKGKDGVWRETVQPQRFIRKQDAERHASTLKALGALPIGVVEVR